MRAGAAVLDQQIGHTIDRQRPNLTNVRSVVQHTGSNHFIKLKRFINELERGNQHNIKVSRFSPQIK